MLNGHLMYLFFYLSEILIPLYHWMKHVTWWLPSIFLKIVSREIEMVTWRHERHFIAFIPHWNQYAKHFEPPVNQHSSFYMICWVYQAFKARRRLAFYGLKPTGIYFLIQFVANKNCNSICDIT